MSQADELLESVSTDISPLLADAETEPHIVVGADRFITVPDELKRIAVQFDHDVETVTFDCPRYWDGLDMSTLGIYINYMRSDKAYGCYRAENIIPDDVDDSIMHFTWTISQNVSLVAGKIQFLVCVRKMDDEGYEENHWNSELCEDMYVSPGMECAEVLLEPYPDLVSQWAEDVQEVKDILLAARDAGELDGATFIPSIDRGILSWTNNRDRVNPVPVDISLNVEVTETAKGHKVDITDTKGTKSFEVLNGGTEVIDQYMRNYVTISETEPAAGPVLWFDTSKESAE